MTDVLASGPNGEGVKVAVVDTGIEVCHPDLRLRGYNGLNAERQFSGLLNSLGVSTYFPNSTDAHVFNMSFGSAAPEPNNIDVYFERVFTHGVRNLRSGLGAIYVKAAGNSFRDCASLERDINESLGCGSSNGDDWSNLPYLIVVGAFNADGVRSSYSSAGANLWISAPGGDYTGRIRSASSARRPGSSTRLPSPFPTTTARG